MTRVPRTPIEDWPPARRAFYADFCRWLRDGGYSDWTLDIYGVAVRLALSLLDKPLRLIDPVADLDRVRRCIATHYQNGSTRSSYLQGINKLAQYLRHRYHWPAPEKQVNWDHYVGRLPGWLADDVRAYVVHCSRAWLPEQRYRATVNALSHLTRFLRWAAQHVTLTHIGDLTPNGWFEYVDLRLEAGVQPNTVNGELRALRPFLQFLAQQGRPVCARLMRVAFLAEEQRLPRDVPPEQLARLLGEIEREADSSQSGVRRAGRMDRAWFLLMLYSGLRTGEVRRLRLSDLDISSSLSAGLKRYRVRVDQSKGLKDRVVCLGQGTVEALRTYLEERGPAATDHVFITCHRPLSHTYCHDRLETYGKRCGVRVTPHQLRHSCATLLLNAGAPILTVQTILGHKFIDTTLAYARLYDGTVAADYYRAMSQIEARMALAEGASSPPTGGQLLALVDALRDGTLNENQRETVQALRAGILALTEQQATEVV